MRAPATTPGDVTPGDVRTRDVDGAVKPAPFDYRRPGLAGRGPGGPGGDPDAKVLAGGQSLVPLLSMRLAAPALLVDINGLPDLAESRVDARRRPGRRAGPARRRARHAEAAGVQPLLALALRHVAHPTIRNRGTTVGSIVHADAAAEMPVVLACSAARSTSASPAGRRTIAPPTSSSGRWSRRCATTRSPSRRSSPRWRRARASPSRRSPGATATTRCAVWPRVRVEGEQVVEVRAGYLVGQRRARPSSTSPASSTGRRATARRGRAARARARRRHPRHRGLPRPAGARADRRVWSAPRTSRPGAAPGQTCHDRGRCTTYA